MIKTVKPQILKQWLNSDEACLIDVREPAEYQKESIKQSHLIPLSQIECAKLPEAAKSKRLVIHCKLGGRSLAACEKLLQENPQLDIYNLEGGIEAWRASGLTCEENSACNVAASSCYLPLERQVQTIAGLLIFTGSLLTIFVGISFVVIPLFVGAGLIFAGLSGWCGMAKLLLKMPWNK